MTDLELTVTCAEAMGYRYLVEHGKVCFPDVVLINGALPSFEPLENQQQAFEVLWKLIRTCYKMEWDLSINGYLRVWSTMEYEKDWNNGFGPVASMKDLQRAIVECMVKAYNLTKNIK